MQAAAVVNRAPAALCRAGTLPATARFANSQDNFPLLPPPFDSKLTLWNLFFQSLKSQTAVLLPNASPNPSSPRRTPGKN